jgi:hypothetical protein
VERLLDDPELRVEMALRARERVAQELDWRPQAEKYLTVFETLTGWHGLTGAPEYTEGQQELKFDHRGRPYVDLTDTIELRRFILERSPHKHESRY